MAASSPAASPRRSPSVTPYSSAWIVAKIAQFTASAHRLSPSRTAGASGSFEKTSSRMTRASGPPSSSGHVDRMPLSWLVSDDQPSQRPGEERLLDQRDVLEGLDVDGRGRERSNSVRDVALGGGAAGDADDGAVHVVERREPAVGGDHHALAVVERRVEERRTLGAVTARGPRGVADEHVDLARLQRREAGVAGLDVDELDLGGVAEHARPRSRGRSRRRIRRARRPRRPSEKPGQVVRARRTSPSRERSPRRGASRRMGPQPPWRRAAARWCRPRPPGPCPRSPVAAMGAITLNTDRCIDLPLGGWCPAVPSGGRRRAVWATVVQRPESLFRNAGCPPGAGHPHRCRCRINRPSAVSSRRGRRAGGRRTR